MPDLSYIFCQLDNERLAQVHFYHLPLNGEYDPIFNELQKEVERRADEIAQE